MKIRDHPFFPLPFTAGNHVSLEVQLQLILLHLISDGTLSLCCSSILMHGILPLLVRCRGPKLPGLKCNAPDYIRLPTGKTVADNFFHLLAHNFP